MAIPNSLLGQISKTWLEAEKKAKPKASHIVIVTKRPKLVEDQKSVARVFGKTKFRVGIALLAEESELLQYSSYAKYCTCCEI